MFWRPKWDFDLVLIIFPEARSRRPTSPTLWIGHLRTSLTLPIFDELRWSHRNCRRKRIARQGTDDIYRAVAAFSHPSSPIPWSPVRSNTWRKEERLTRTGESSKLSSTKMKALLSMYTPTSPRLSARRRVLRLTEMARSGDGNSMIESRSAVKLLGLLFSDWSRSSESSEEDEHREPWKVFVVSGV